MELLGNVDAKGALQRNGVSVVVDSGQIMGYVNHGTDAGVARPNIVGAVTWVGTVDPTNKVAGDIWMNPSGA